LSLVHFDIQLHAPSNVLVIPSSNLINRSQERLTKMQTKENYQPV